MADTDRIATEMMAGLDGVTPGPWRPSRFGLQIVSDFPEAAWQSVVELRTIAQTYPSTEKEMDSQQAIANHLARCDPDSIRALLSEREADKERIKALEKACRNIRPYLIWTIGDESPGYHPTMPSAVGAFCHTVWPDGYDPLKDRPALAKGGEHRGAVFESNPTAPDNWVRQSFDRAKGGDNGK